MEGKEIGAAVEAKSCCGEKKKGSPIFEFMQLAGKLKRLRRTGWVKCEVKDAESVADHSWRMAATLMAMEPKDLGGADRNISLKMALIHDLAEGLVGDITPYCGVSDQEKFEREQAAMKTICAEINAEMGAELFRLWTEFEMGGSLEAQLVKDLDIIERTMQALEYQKLQSVDLERFFAKSPAVKTDFGRRLHSEICAARDHPPVRQATSVD